ncbi:retrovirus-related pol polyprotein from transposon RE1 [Citrus sinensis]|nr:retrovirus-related pol polyprotein from transposon RE1 [Citrus sinensis]
MTNISQKNISFNFVTPIKLDQNNFILWRTQVLTTVKGNGLEGFINGDNKCPEQFLISESYIESVVSTGGSRSINAEFVAWMKTDQLLLSWMMSSIQQNLLSTVIDCTTSKQLWETLTGMFISQSQARIQTLRMQIQTIKKGSMHMADYFAKVKRIADTLALAGKPVELGDLIMHVLTGLDSSDYESLVTAVLARGDKITLDELYALLLNHEIRIEQKRGKITSDVMHNMTANVAQRNTYSGKNNGGFQKNYVGNFGNGNSSGFGGFNGGASGNSSGQFSNGNNFYDVVCQICYIPGHEAYKCRNRYNSSFVPQKNYGGSGFQGNIVHVENSFGTSSAFYSFTPGSSTYTPTETPDNSGQYNASTSSSLPPSNPNVSPELVEDPSWYFDSGATNHITNDLGKLLHSQAYTGEEKLFVGNGNALVINHIGSAMLTTSTSKPLLLNHVIYVPNITKNLLSISKLVADNFVVVEFLDNSCFVKARDTGITLLEGVAKGGLYQVKNIFSQFSQSSQSAQSAFFNSDSFNKPESLFASCAMSHVNKPEVVKVSEPSLQSVFSAVALQSVSMDVFHRRLGHPAPYVLKTIFKACNDSAIFNKIEKLSFCNACQYGKNHMLHFNSVETKTTLPLQLIYADLWGPSHTFSTQGYKYYLSILDDFSRFTWIFPLSAKSDAIEVFSNFKLFIENHLQLKIKTVQTDWGGEFRTFTSLLKASGIHFRHSCPHIHHQNGRIERKHRHIVDIGLTLLAQAHLPLKFWWNAFHTAVYLINRLPTPVLNNISPFQKLFNQTPNYSFLRTFGCACYPALRPYNKHKLDFKTCRCIFLGYSSYHKGYLCLHSSGRIYTSNHVVFYKSSFPYVSGLDFSSPDKCQSPVSLSKSSSSSSSSSVPSFIHLQVPLATSSTSIPDASQTHINQNSSSSVPTESFSPSTHHSPAHTLPLSQSTGHQMITRSKAGIFKPKTYLSALLAQPSEPLSTFQALADPMWFQAMQEELHALQNNKTWELVLPDTLVKIVGNKWVFIIKYNSDGSLSRYKARLVAKGFHQTQGVDYTETFSPVVKASTVRVILSLAVLNKWVIRQVDVNNAFLNGILVEEVYMAQPEGFVNSAKLHHICKLKKAIYGLKHAPRAWFDRFKYAMTTQWHFQHSKSDSSLFYKWINGHVILVLVYVDDIILTGSNPQLIQQVIQDMHHTFALKDLGDLNYFLGIEVVKSATGLYLSQAKYIADILAKHDMVYSSPVSTPTSTSQYLTKDSDDIIQNVSQYRSIVGALQYVTLTRPDIAYSVNKLSQFLSNPRTSHWDACKRLLRYLKGNLHLGLHFHMTGALQLHCFTDSDWASDRDDRKSVAGYAVYLGPNLGAIALAYNPVYHAKTKHVELDIHFIRDKVAAKSIEVSYVPSDDQSANILTKALSFKQFDYLQHKLNVYPGHFNLRGDVSDIESRAQKQSMTDCS